MVNKSQPSSHSSRPRAKIHFTEIPKDIWGFEEMNTQVELLNIAMPELVSPGISEIVGTVDLRTMEDKFVVNLFNHRIEGPINIGENVKAKVCLYMRTFEGSYKLHLGLHRVPLDGSPPTHISDVDTLPVQIEVKDTIREAFIELTNICNFRCTFCPSVSLKRPRMNMDIELAVKVVHDLVEMGHHHPIRVHLLGEPLLFPYFAEFVMATHELGQTITLATNGSRFQLDRINMLFETKLDEIVISLNTPDKEVYKTQRGTKLGFEDYIAGIEEFIAELIRRGPPPKTSINLLYDGNKAEDPTELRRVRCMADDFINLTRKLGGRPLPSADEAIHLDPNRPNEGNATKLALFEGLYLQWTPYHDWGGGNPPPTDQHFCVLPWQHLVVLANGNVTACCLDSEGKIVLGNARNQSINDIWSSDELQRIRAGFKGMKAVHPLCKGCSHSDNKQDNFP